MACSSVADPPCLLGNPRGVVWAKTYAGASHLRNENEQGSQMGEISCGIASNGQRIIPGMPQRSRSREQTIPSIRKRFILSDYARAGEESQQRRECLFDEKQGFSVVFWWGQQWYGDRSDERVSEVVVVVVVRLCAGGSGQVSINGRASWCQLPPNPFVNGETAMQRVQHRPPQGQTLIETRPSSMASSSSLYLCSCKISIPMSLKYVGHARAWHTHKTADTTSI